MLSFSQLIRRAASINHGGVATRCENRVLTWGATLERVRALAGVLRGLGLAPGDRVAILSGNSDFYFQFLFAVPWAGGVTVPINTRLAPAEIEYWLADSGSRFLLVGDSFLDTVLGLRGKLASLERIVCIGEREPAGCDALQGLLAAHLPMDDAGRAGDDLAALFYTGGTSGRSKGVMLTHQGFVLSTMQWALGVGVSAEDVILIAAPMFHMVAGLNSVAAALLAASACIMPRFDPLDALRTIEAHRITKVALVPAMVDSIVSHPQARSTDLSSLRRITYGAAPMPESILRRALQVMPGVRFYQIYGQTESGPNISMLTPEHHIVRDNSVSPKHASAGQALLGVDIAILDEHDRPVARGACGEICVRSPCVSPGYWNLPEETARFLHDGWAHTGDAGYLDEDGFLHVVDRIKDMIISGGENIYSAEVERVLYLHPAIAECAVIGIPHDYWGEQVHAVVRLHAGATLNEADLFAFCRQHLAGYKCVRSVEFRGEPLPRNGADKILKRELRQPYWTGRQRAV